jgi:hypothetical protein
MLTHFICLKMMKMFQSYFYFVYRINYILSYDLVYNKLRIAMIVECLIVMIRDAVESVS